MIHPSLAGFHPLVAGWFEKTFGTPTPPQTEGWPLIAKGENVLILAPTGSGKTLAAFLKTLDFLYQEAAAGRKIDDGVRVLYISPLKALNNDVHRNLAIPLSGINAYAEEFQTVLPMLSVGVRTGDTPAKERQQMIRRPPQILITTPESLFLMLSSKAGQILKTVRFVIVDEIHNLFPNKRGAHLALSLERLQHLVGEDRPLQRIGLSATLHPLEKVAAYLGGYQKENGSGRYMPRPVAIVDSGRRKEWDLQILLPTQDLRDLPEKSIWPPLYDKLVELIKDHRTTLIFVNNRRLAERITANINQISGSVVARTHHGSVSKEVRLEVEKMLKTGALACIVATASLELGIDIGYIDLVIQVESPKEVARGLQRVGRAGHVVGMPSKGRIIPKNRADLLEAAAIMREMKAGRIEPVKAPLNCLDILAQQIVAMTAEGDWDVAEVFQTVRRAYNFQALTLKQLENVLGMLSGNFDAKEFLELRPRLYWDRIEGVLKPEPLGKRLIYSSGGTIPDRGYFGVYLAGSNARLGELDEEFVYERRLNERFVLGTSMWRIEEIRQDRVIVTPARRGEAIIPFWKADQNGRPFELGRSFGAFLAAVEDRLSGEGFISWIEAECGLTMEAAVNLQEYVSAQKQAAGFLQTDKRIVIEEFPDEAGEWRILLHSPFGARLHTALALIIKDHWEKRYRFEVEAMPIDDGIMFHYPGSDELPDIIWDELPTEDLETRMAALISPTPLFGTTFRHSAQTSLVMPRYGYGKKRTPLWLMRLKAGNLLQVVSKYPDFPLVTEAYRAVLQDYFNLDALRQVLQALQTGEISIHRLRHKKPSPFAHLHLFNFTDSFMYETDAPKGERRLSLFGLGYETLRAMIGAGELRKLFDGEVIEQVHRQARGFEMIENDSAPERLQNWFEKVGDLYPGEIEELFPQSGQAVRQAIEGLVQAGKLLILRFGEMQSPIYIAAHDARTYAYALDGVEFENPAYNMALQKEPPHLAPEARRSLVNRYARTRGPFQAGDIVGRYHFDELEVQEDLSALAADGLIEAGEFTPGVLGEEWCDIGLLKEIQRRSLAKARREVEACAPKVFAVFLAEWQGIKRPECVNEDIAGVLTRFSTLWLPARVWEENILSGRVKNYVPSLLDNLIAGGQVFWRARGDGARADAKLEICFENTLPETGASAFSTPLSGDAMPKPPPCEELIRSRYALQVYQLLKAEGALFLPRILQKTGFATPCAWEALEELMCLGLITNDSFGPVRFLLESDPRDRQGARGVLQPAVMARMGRWSAIKAEEGDSAGVSLDIMAYKLLRRYGLVCREIAAAEALAWGDLYSAFDMLENTGKIRRGYFVEGLSGIQYALPEAVEKLRRAREREESSGFMALAWDDPGNVLRFFSEWPGDGARALKEFRYPADYVVYDSGEPIMIASGRKLKIQTVSGLPVEILNDALRCLVHSLYSAYHNEKIVITHLNGMAIVETEAAHILTGLGFEKGYRETTLWPSQRKR